METPGIYLLLALGLPLLGSPLVALAGRKLGPRVGSLALAFPVISTGALLALAAAVIVTGIGSSAFYGNAACTALLQCGTPHSPLQLAWLEPLVLDAAGRVVTPDGAGTLQWLHRLLGALLTAGFAAALFIARRARTGAATGLAAASIATLIGLAAAGDGVPIAAAVIHSLSGLAVVLVVLAMLRRA